MKLNENVYQSMDRNLKIVRRESKYFLYREILVIKSMIIYYIYINNNI